MDLPDIRYTSDNSIPVNATIRRLVGIDLFAVRQLGASSSWSNEAKARVWSHVHIN